MSKEPTPEMSTLAARVMKGYEPTPAEIKSLAGCVVSLDQTKGQEPRQRHSRKVKPPGNAPTTRARLGLSDASR